MSSAQEITQTMQVFGHQDCRSWSMRQRTESVVKAELTRDDSKLLFQIIEAHPTWSRERYPLIKHTIFCVGVLLGINDVPTDGCNPTGDTGNNANFVAT